MKICWHENQKAKTEKLELNANNKIPPPMSVLLPKLHKYPLLKYYIPLQKEKKSVATNYN